MKINFSTHRGNELSIYMLNSFDEMATNDLATQSARVSAVVVLM